MLGLWENTLIAKDSHELMLAVILGIVAISIILEQRYAWASKMTGAVIALLGAMLLTNLKIIPIGSDIENMVWSYVVPMALPMLLLKANIFEIWKGSGRLLLLFLVSSVGTVVGALVAIVALGSLLKENALVADYIPGMAAMMSASYTGGGVNFAAMAENYQVTGTPLTGAVVVADNLLMVIYIFVLISFVSMPLMRKLFKTPYIDATEKQSSTAETHASQFWKRKEISLKDIAIVFAIAALVVAVSLVLSDAIKNTFQGKAGVTSMLVTFFGNKYLIITTITLIIASVFPKKLDQVEGSDEFGTFLIYSFFVVIGIPASIGEIIQNAPVLLVFSSIMVISNMLFTFVFAKLFSFSLEEAIVTSNANIGGPTTAAAIAISKGWKALIAPILLVGTLGYVIGNYLGVLVGNITSGMGF